MTDLRRRAASLSPERKKLYQALLRQRQHSAGGSPFSNAEADSAPPNEGQPLITRARFDFETDAPLAKPDVRRFYDTVSQQLNHSMYREYSLFLNYGYIPNDAPSLASLAPRAHAINRNCVRLILELLGDLPLSSEQTFLDVGCGRGGTLEVLHRYFRVTRAIGLDLAPSAIEFCRVHFQDTQFRFVEGDAEAMPVADGSVDIVTNVESSHCYPALSKFYDEVRRVLRPGGWFLYTDLFPSSDIASRERELSERGLTLEHRRDITANVLLSCDEKANASAAAFAEANDADLMRRFLGVPDSALYNAMKNGQQRYMMYRHRKDG